MYYSSPPLRFPRAFLLLPNRRWTTGIRLRQLLPRAPARGDWSERNGKWCSMALFFPGFYLGALFSFSLCVHDCSVCARVRAFCGRRFSESPVLFFSPPTVLAAYGREIVYSAQRRLVLCGACPRFPRAFLLLPNRRWSAGIRLQQLYPRASARVFRGYYR